MKKRIEAKEPKVPRAGVQLGRQQPRDSIGFIAADGGSFYHFVRCVVNNIHAANEYHSRERFMPSAVTRSHISSLELKTLATFPR